MAHREYLLAENDGTNIEFSERVVSIGTGTYMIYKGVRELFKRPLLALGQVAIGSALLYRGATGTCDVKRIIEREYQESESPEYI
ncbi:DUF2892 domain-containing protein [Olivibacter sp. XZL3]|uniref:YgaP family membrane protein n=1 Tax=Olivibacter sp. XZL3 TaxID=1735116 RepID=UPI00106690B1|nr:DUF2892 domain-containing protein [Olivibacter sp. XZL3]